MSQYEFSEKENQIIDSLSKWMLVFGWFLAAASLAALIVPSVLHIIQNGFELLILTEIGIGIVVVLFGVAFILPVDNLKRIVKTEGSDIDELMTALKEIGLFLGIGLVMAILLIPLIFIESMLIG